MKPPFLNREFNVPPLQSPGQMPVMPGSQPASGLGQPMEEPQPQAVLIDIDSDMEKLITETVIEEFKCMEDARNEKEYFMDDKGTAFAYEDKLMLLTDAFYGKRKVKSSPWANCSNRSLRLSMAIIELLHSQMFPAVYNDDLSRWRPGEKNDKPRVERITNLMFWWTKVHSKIRVFFDKWCKMALAYGDVLVETSWEEDRLDTGQTTQSPVLDEFDIPLTEQDGSPAIVTDKIFKTEYGTRRDIIASKDVFFAKGARNVLKDPVGIRCSYTYEDLELMEARGQAVNISTPEFEDGKCLYDLLKDKFNNIGISGENAEVIKEVKLRAEVVDCIKMYRKIDFDRDGYAEDCRILVDPLHQLYFGAVKVSDISKRNRRPLNFVKVSDLIDRPDDLEGFGYLEMVKPLADEIDAIFNQLTDGNTLQCLSPGFYDPSGSLVPQTVTLSPNKWTPVPDPQRNVYVPQINIPTEKLILALKMVLEFVERLTGASSYIMGKESEIVGGSGTATRTMEIMNSAHQRFALPADRLRAGAAAILTTELDILQRNFPPGLDQRILGEDGEPVFTENELNQDGISGEFDAYLISDPGMGSPQVQKQMADLIFQSLMGNPLVASDPTKIYNETAMWLKAYGQDPVEHLGPAPDMKMFSTPEDENTQMIQGNFDGIRAVLTENHIMHIQVHTGLLESPAFAMLSPGQQQMVSTAVQGHIQEHMQLMAQLASMVAKVQNGPKGNNGQSSQPGNGGQPAGPAQPSSVENLSPTFSQVQRTKTTGAGNNTPSGKPGQQ